MGTPNGSATTATTKALPRIDLRPTTAKNLRAILPLRIAGVIINVFSRVGQRSPPSNTKTEHVRLISIAASHFVEKARWGLDLLEANSKSPIYYTEDLHPPAFSSFHTVPASNDQASQTPMVILPPNGRALWGSDAILRELCSDPETVDLYPKEIEGKIKEIEDDLALRLGATARCVAYSCLLDKSKEYYGAASKLLTLQCPRIEQIVFEKMLDKGIAKTMKGMMEVDEKAADSETEIRKVFDEISNKLEENGGEYIMDTPTKKYGFTAADLTFSALSYFLIRPPQMGPFTLSESESPPKMLALGKELCETMAGKHVLNVYHKHRPIDASTGEILLKKVDQNRFLGH